MKTRLLLTGLCLLFQLFSFSQGTSLKVSTAYVYNFNLQLTSDTSIIFSGDAGFASVVNNQTFLWYKRPAFPGSFINRDLVRTSDSTFCAFGSVSNPTENLAAITIFNKDGIFKSGKSFSSISSFEKAIPINKNFILALASTVSDNGFSLMKLDYTGNPILTKKIKPVFDVQISPYDFYVLNKINNNLFLATICNYEKVTKQFDLTTFAVDSSLQVLWVNTSGGKGDEKPVCALDLDGKHYTICQTTSFGAGKNDILIICRNNAGAILWNKTIGSRQYNEFPLEISLDKDSSLLISGYVKEKSDFTERELGLLLKVTKEGEPVWTRIFEPPAGYEGMRIGDAYINRFQNISTVFSLTTQTNSRPQAGFMELKPSGKSICAGKPLLLKQKKVVLPEKEIVAGATVLTPVMTEANVVTENFPITVRTLCANACSTKADMRVSKTHVCKGNSIDFVNTSTDNDSIRWLLNGIKMSNTTSFTPVFATAGNQTVSLIAYGSLCNDTLAVSIVVDDLPIANFSYTQQNLEGTFTNLSVSALADTWQMGDGTTYSSVDVHHFFSQLGVYNVCLIASNVCSSDTMCQSYRAEDHSNFTLNAHYNFSTSSANEWSTSICQDPDGNLIVAMDDNHHGSSGVAVSIMKINKEGKILKQGILSKVELSRGKVFSLAERGYMVLANGGEMFLVDLKSSWYTEVRTLDDFYPWFAQEAGNKKDIYFGGFGINHKGAVLKRNEYGNKLWAKNLFYSNNIVGMVELKNGDLLVYGKSMSAGAYLARLNGTNGNLIWSKSYTSPAGMTGEGIWYDPRSERIYMSGSSLSPHSGFFIMKADTNGNLIWQKALATEDITGVSCFANQYDQLFVCYTGYNKNTICRFDTTGNLQWIKNYRDPSVGGGYTSSTFYNLCHDGGIATAGNCRTFAGAKTYASVIKVDTAGNSPLSCPFTSVTLTNLPYTIVPNVNGIDSVSNNNGPLRYPDYRYDSLLRYETTINCASSSCNELLKYAIVTQSGLQFHFQPSQPASLVTNLHWDFGDGTSSNAYSPIHTFAAQGHYKICLTGMIAGCGSLAYCNDIDLILTDAEEKAANEYYLNIFPNPYIGSTSIEYNLVKKSMVTVQVFNTMGQLIKTLQDGEQPTGSYSLSYTTKKESPAGLYFLRLTVDGKSIVRHMEEVR